MAQQDFPALSSRPSTSDLQGENPYAQLARKHWLRSKGTPRVLPKVLKEELWDRLEKEEFAFGSLLLLENLQAVESYLWPGYTEDSSNYHVLLLALLVNVKLRESLPAWEHFSDKPTEFSTFFRRILSLSVDHSISLRIRTHLVCFIIGAFQSLDSGIVRKECAPLVSISIWHNLHNDAVREEKLEKSVALRKAWRAAAKRYDAGDDATKARLRFERSWLSTLLLDFLARVYDTTKLTDEDNVLYCERFLELLADLQSQIPTRRYVNTLVQDLNLLAATKLSPLFADEDNALFRDLFILLRHYTYFPIDDQRSQALSQKEHHDAHCAKLVRLQRIAMKHFNSKLTILALSNFGSLDQRTDLESHLEDLDVSELVQLCHLLRFRTEYPEPSVVLDRAFYIEVLILAHERRPTFQDTVRELTILPTERTLYEATFLRNETYTGTRPLAIPKLNLQYLTIGDFLWRSFILHRCESFYEIKKDMQDVVKRMQPRAAGTGTRFDGSSRMALHIDKPAVIEVSQPQVGELTPSRVRAEVILDVSRLNFGVRKDWESLRSNDVVFLLAVQPYQESLLLSNGHTEPNSGEKLGLRFLRAAEVIQVLDENGRPLREQDPEQTNGRPYRHRKLRVMVKLDAAAYQEDIDSLSQGRPNVYENINLIVRRRGRENNFKPILESIKRLTLSDIPAPSWMQEVFLGYGDPASATYKRLSTRLRSIDFRDTFLDWQHLVQSLPGKTVEPGEEVQSSFSPPYVLEFPEAENLEVPVRPSKKRRRDHTEVEQQPQPTVQAIKVATYKPPNTGPYLANAPRLNAIRFTPAQVEAITSGTQPGLTVIVGPPGTGKTDVATQIINNIYHNFPSQRTLLIAHSNQALNQLFQKIVALDIDERHLLRLGHGEEELETEVSYSKHGRVESFLENGTRYLAEVDRLAATLKAPGAHGSSCETAGYFNSVYVKPIWMKYWENVQSGDFDKDQIVEHFPFHEYFSDAPQPLFSPDAHKDDILDIAAGCYRHVEKIFAELEDIRPFEILRNPRDKANYLLVKEARIIAMTSTHAAMRRQEIADLGFHYDNVIVEEAAQITEIENFIPLAMQQPKDGELPLQRVVLCGDHLQNSPIIQNLAFRQYAKLEQSLFQRLVRLGVPTVLLDHQGRARPSLSDLYRWRYPRLGDLPHVVASNPLSAPAFRTANAGFRHEYQFVQVADYKGRGETEPTPHFVQNLGEAEYAVALFMYMRLLGYPASRVSILTTYAGQRALIRDVLAHRCAKNRLFGLPRLVTTVDKYQGEQNDYIILSLTRTSRVGYLRDIRRLTVALSRARLGLYVLGRREVFESCYELREAFDRLLDRPDKLALVPGETFPTQRGLDDEVDSTEMEGVEHLGQYVYEMTQAKVAALKAGAGALPAQVEGPMDEDIMEDDVEEMDAEDDDEEGGEEGVEETVTVGEQLADEKGVGEGGL